MIEHLGPPKKHSFDQCATGLIAIPLPNDIPRHLGRTQIPLGLDPRDSEHGVSRGAVSKRRDGVRVSDVEFGPKKTSQFSLCFVLVLRKRGFQLLFC